MSKPTGSKTDLEQCLIELEDLSDFCENWPQIKSLIDQSALPDSLDDPGQRQLFDWLILLADRVCRLDTQIK